MPISNSTIYLDHNATTIVDPRVLVAMQQALAEGIANPSSSHAPGRHSKRRLEDAREAILLQLGADPRRHRLIFTSGGTESNNLALRGLAGPEGSRVIVSAIEHPSISAVADHLITAGYDVQRVPVSRDGFVLVDALDSLLTPETRLVSVMLANHETGAIQPIHEIAQRCHRQGILLHTDAAQAMGKIPFDMVSMDIDAVTFTPHKFHGPLGLGGLVVRNDIEIHPILFGGPQQLGARPGTENVLLAVGMQAALTLAVEDLDQRQRHLARMRDLLERALLALTPSPFVVSQAGPRVPQTLCACFPGRNRQALAIALDRRGIACSTGSACASGSNRPSPVLQAMGLDESLVQGALRFSVGVGTTEEEIQRASQIVGEVVQTQSTGQISASPANGRPQDI